MAKKKWYKYGKKAIQKAITGSGGLKTVIAKRLGCSRTTLYEYIEELPDIAEWIEDEREQVGDICESKIIKAIKEENTTMIIFYAKCKLKDRGYVETLNVDSTSSDGTMSPVSTKEHAEAVAEATDEILRKYHGIDDKAI